LVTSKTSANRNTLESGAVVPRERIPERLTREQLRGVARWQWWAILTARARRPRLQERRRRRLAERWALLEVRKLSATVDVWNWDEGAPGRGFTYDRERSAETDADETVTWVEQRENPSLRVEHRAGRHRRGTDPAAAFLDSLTDFHELNDTEFLVDGMGYLTAPARHHLSGHLDYNDGTTSRSGHRPSRCGSTASARSGGVVSSVLDTGYGDSGITTTTIGRIRRSTAERLSRRSSTRQCRKMRYFI
jgi:hypothetical protein